MQIKEHVQFLVMMIPTLLLLIAATITLALPAQSAPIQCDIEPTYLDLS